MDYTKNSEAVNGSHPLVEFSLWNKKSVDWRNVPNVVSEVKHQGGCGSCWAFTAVGVLEGAYAIKTGEAKSFSE